VFVAEVLAEVPDCDRPERRFFDASLFHALLRQHLHARLGIQDVQHAQIFVEILDDERNLRSMAAFALCATTFET
jgi:hypothetical protein